MIVHKTTEFKMDEVEGYLMLGDRQKGWTFCRFSSLHYGEP